MQLQIKITFCAYVKLLEKISVTAQLYNKITIIAKISNILAVAINKITAIPSCDHTRTKRSFIQGNHCTGANAYLLTKTQIIQITIRINAPNKKITSEIQI